MLAGALLARGQWPDNALSIRTMQKCVTHDQHIHVSAQETIESLARFADHRLIFIERGVEHHRYAGEIAKAVDKAIVERIGAFGHCLQAAGAVHMRNRRDERSLFGPDLEYL